MHEKGESKELASHEPMHYHTEHNVGRLFGRPD
jgi:hypothetical protein